MTQNTTYPRIYRFGSLIEGSADMADALGGKAARCCGMTALGVPVPPGFTFPCQTSIDYLKSQLSIAKLADLMQDGLEFLQSEMGYMPLVSVRSGSRKSMPGMMDTILNVGLTSTTLPEWEERIGAWAARDSYRRLIEMLATVARGYKEEVFDDIRAELRQSVGVAKDQEFTAEHLTRLIGKYLSAIAQFPDTLEEQLLCAVRAVFASWDNPRAAEYRNVNKIPYEWGTSATIQAMVFGNADDQSCSGVAFTRNPSTGNKEPLVDWLPKCQGEDVVAAKGYTSNFAELAKWAPSVAEELNGIMSILELAYKDMQDIEFTVQSGVLYILQPRNGQRSAQAAFQIAYDLAQENVISCSDAVTRVNRKQLFAAMTSRVDPSYAVKPIVTGIPAGGGVVSGKAMFSATAAINCKEPCILVSKETTPDDFAGMVASVGILTATGGATSHAAVVARGMNKTCIVGTTSMEIVGYTNAYTNGVPLFKEGSTITIDGSTGNVWVGEAPIISGEPTHTMRQICYWAVIDKDVTERIDVQVISSSKLQAVVDNLMLPNVYLDFAALQFANANLAAQGLSKLGNLLQNPDFHSIIVDLTPLKYLGGHSDRVFDRMFQIEATDNSLAIRKALESWPDETREKTFLKEASMVGFKEVKVIKNFADLLKAEGPVCAYSDDVHVRFGSKETFNRACQLVSKDKNINIYPALPTYWYSFLE